MSVPRPSGIPIHSAMTLRIPPGTVLLSPTLAALRDLAGLLGFPPEEGARLELALEEALAALTAAAPSPEDQELEIRFRRVPLGLRISLAGYRRPLSRQALSSYVPGGDPEEDGGSGLGFHMLLHLTDQVTLVEGASDRQELHFFKRLPGGLSPEGLPGGSPPRRTSEELRPTEATPVLPSEAGRLSQEEAFLGLPWEEWLADPSGVLLAARDRTGRILALQGWEPHEARPSLGVVGPCRLLPEAAERACRALLEEALVRLALREGQRGLLAARPLEGTASAPAEGFAPCALLPFTPPLPFAPPGRGPCALLFRPLGPSEPLDRPGPPALRDLLRGLYAGWGREVPDREPSPAPGAPSRRSLLSVTSHVREGRAELRVHAYGPDFPLRLRELTTHLRGREYGHLLLHLPLDLADTAFEADEAEAQGYLLAGVLPGTPGGDELLYLHRSGLPLPRRASTPALAICPALAGRLTEGPA